MVRVAPSTETLTGMAGSEDLALMFLKASLGGQCNHCLAAPSRAPAAAVLSYLGVASLKDSLGRNRLEGVRMIFYQFLITFKRRFECIRDSGRFPQRPAEAQGGAE